MRGLGYESVACALPVMLFCVCFVVGWRVMENQGNHKVAEHRECCSIHVPPSALKRGLSSKISLPC